MVSSVSPTRTDKSVKNCIKFTKLKAVLGLCLGFISYFIHAHYSLPRPVGICLTLFFIFLGLFEIDLNAVFPKRLSSFFYAAIHVAGVVIVCMISLNMIKSSCTSTMGTVNLLLNVLIALALFFILSFISGSLTTALIITSVILLSMSVVNFFVLLYRQKEFCATDILSARTVLNVAGNYSFFIPPELISHFLQVFLVVFAQFCVKQNSFAKIYDRIICLSIALLCAVTVFFSSKDNNVIMGWSTEGSEKNGFFLNFYLSFRDSFVQVPPDYSPQAVDSISNLYTYSPAEAPSVLPNVIVIMNETFADLDIFSKPLSTSEAVIPFVSSLDENTIRGNALVSVFGGSTANSELEFLSGSTMLFFPNGTDVIPYQQFIQDEIYVLPKLMTSLGYDTLATHPFDRRSWSREQLYPLFGFDQVTFLDDYPQQDLIRSLVSDQEMYEYLLDKLYSHDSGRPLFMFGVTIQNHGDYSPRENYQPHIKLSDYPQLFPQAEQYLSLINESDKAVEYLLRELEDYPEDTIVLFFGDHLPNIESELYTLLNNGAPTSLDERMLKYTVPFFIWANYDIEEYTLEKTSLNYLAGHLLDAAGIELPPYYQFLRETEEIIPAINAFGYYSKARGCMIPLEEAEGEEAEALQRYEFVQYNNMFDAKNRNYTFFAQYMN